MHVHAVTRVHAGLGQRLQHIDSVLQHAMVIQGLFQ